MSLSKSQAIDVLAAGYIGRPAVREVVHHLPVSSVRWSTHGYPDPFARWHFHPEYEIHLIQRTTGRYIIGNEIGSFGPGQLVIVGPNVPHDWISEIEPTERVEDRDVVLQFHGDWIARCTDVIPEMSDLDGLLARATRGIEFSGETAERGAQELLLIGQSSGIKRVQHIFTLLALLASAPSKECRYLMSGWVPQADSLGALEVVNKAIDYIFENIGGTVRLSRAAEIAGMSSSAFSRYFKTASGHTFSDMVVRLRLAEACRLLETTDKPIARISEDAGYSNLSNFNRQFRSRYGLTPREYRKQTKEV